MFKRQIKSLLQFKPGANPICGHMKAEGTKPAEFKEALQTTLSSITSITFFVICLAFLRKDKFREMAKKNTICLLPDHDKKQATKRAEVEKTDDKQYQKKYNITKTINALNSVNKCLLIIESDW